MQSKGSGDPSRLQCCFFVMDFDSMRGWRAEKMDRYRSILSNQELPLEIRDRIYENPYGLYETPKTYGEGHVAYNDGSWLIYQTERMAGGKFKHKIFCKDKEAIVKHLYNYLLFLYVVGITERYEMMCYAYAFITYKFRFRKGMFNPINKNKELIRDLVLSVNKKDVKDIDMCSRADERKFAFDPKYLKIMKTREGLDRKKYTSMQKKTQKEMTDQMIRENYDPDKSIGENYRMFNLRGIKISKERLREWVNEYLVDNEANK